MVTIGKDILRYGGTGLCAIPSVHFDVVFADLVRAASLQRAFDVVAVELPCTLDPAALADAVDALWPTAGVAVCDGARRAHGMLEAGSDQDGSLASQTPVFRTHVVPIVPCDSIVAAVRASRQMRREDGPPAASGLAPVPRGGRSLAFQAFAVPAAHAWYLGWMGIPYLLAGRRAYAVDRRASGSGDDLERRSLPSVPAPLSRTERMAAGLLPYIRSVPPEDTLQRAMVRHAWMLGDSLGHHRRSKAGATRSARFTGDLGQGIDWRRTLRAWADGEPEREFYVKAAARRGRRGRPPSRAARSQAAGRPCPVAWIFAPSATIEQRACARMFDTYSSFYGLRAVVRGAGNITRETVGYCVNVLRGRSDWDEASVRRMLDALPPAEHPRIAPWDDPELAGFRGPGLAVAAAVRWAHDRAIVVADHGCDLGLACQAYARRRGVDLVKISWDAFGDDARRRLAVQHTAPSKSHFADPPPCVLRVIPPDPAFNPPRGFGERMD